MGQRLHTTGLPDVFGRAQTFAAGLSRGQIAWALRSGRLVALRRGAYCTRETYDAASAAQRHLLHAQAAALTHDERHVVSHLSAALSWGLPAPFGELGRATLTLPGAPSSTDRQDDLVVQVAELRPEEVTGWRGFRRTSVTRTAADCLRHLPTPDAVAIADAAVHAGRTSVEAISSTIIWQSGWPYAERGRRSLGLVDGRRESPLESRSFVALSSRGIPLPEPQVAIYDGGEFVARPDGLWGAKATVCEADGHVKYSIADWPDLSAVDVPDLAEARAEGARRAVIAEKVREDRIRSLGLEVVRWGTFDITHRLDRVVRDIHRAWARGARGQVSARFVSAPTSSGWDLAVRSLPWAQNGPS